MKGGAVSKDETRDLHRSAWLWADHDGRIQRAMAGDFTFHFLQPGTYHIRLDVTGLDAAISNWEDLTMTLEDLRKKVEEQSTVTQSVVTLVTLLADQLRNHADDPVKIQEIANSLDANTQRLSDAVQANPPPAA